MLHLIAVLILLSANALLAVFVNYTAGHFMTAIEQKSITEFYHYLLVYIGAFVVTPVHVFYDLMRTRLALVWRKWLSARLFSLYYSDLAYYKLSKNNEIDNPDQRMTQDCRLILQLFSRSVHFCFGCGSQCIDVYWSALGNITDSDLHRNCLLSRRIIDCRINRQSTGQA